MNALMPPIIEVKGVKKSFGSVKALRGIDISVEEGQVYALLGPNGAGKTTLVRILATLLSPDEGSVVINGIDLAKDPAKIRQTIGLAGQFAAVDEFLTGRETLEMVARLYGLPKKEATTRANQLLKQLSLEDAADRQAKTYSGGMRRRLDLGASLVVAPKVIFLDEPTTGLDPRTRLELWSVIRELAAHGSTILLTTQYLEEADALANYITVIDKGEIAIQGTASSLKDSLGADLIETVFTDEDCEQATEVLRNLELGEVRTDSNTGKVSVPAKNGSKTLLVVAEALAKAKIEPTEISLRRPSLDDVFLAVTGHSAQASAEEKKPAASRRRK